MSEVSFFVPSGYEPIEALQAYCVQCVSGHERGLAERVNMHYSEITALAVLQETHRSQGGIKTLTQQVMLPGYVFLFSSLPLPFHEMILIPNVLRFLTYGQGQDRSLRGEDLAFANWLLRHGGLFSCSKAVREGSRLEIIHGPLKDHIGTVEKVDRHNRNVCLSIAFSENTRTVWMPFQWAEETVNPCTNGFLRKQQDSVVD